MRLHLEPLLLQEMYASCLSCLVISFLFLSVNPRIMRVLSQLYHIITTVKSLTSLPYEAFRHFPEVYVNHES